MNSSNRSIRFWVGARVLLLSIVFLCLSACALPITIIDFYDMDSATLRRYSAMQVISAQSVSEDEYIELGAVEGMFCQKLRGQLTPGAERDAIDQVKLKAAAIGADYVTTPQCVIEGLANTCFSRVVCSSSAIKEISP